MLNRYRYYIELFYQLNVAVKRLFCIFDIFLNFRLFWIFHILFWIFHTFSCIIRIFAVLILEQPIFNMYQNIHISITKICI